MTAGQVDDAFREMMKQLAAAGFATTAAASFADNTFFITGSSDATKKVAFEVDGITTGTTRTVTIPNSSGTLAYNTAASTTTAGISEFATAAEYRTGTDTARSLVVDQVWSAATGVSLTDAATVAVDMSTFINALLTLGGNRTLGAPSNAKPGQSGWIYIQQDATGSRTLAYHANWKFAFGTDPVLSTAAFAVDMLFYTVVNDTIIVANLVKGIA